MPTRNNRRRVDRTEEARDVPHSQRLRDITGRTFQISKRSGGLTTFWDDPQNDWSDRFSNFSYTEGREVTQFENASSQEVSKSIVIDFSNGLTYILVGMLDCSTKGSEESVILSVRGSACCKRLFGRSTDQAFRVPASIQFWPPPTSPRERSTTTSTARKLWDTPSSTRSSQTLHPRQMVAASAERGQDPSTL